MLAHGLSVFNTANSVVVHLNTRPSNTDTSRISLTNYRKLQIDTADYKRQRARTELQALDPLTLTGPEAVTYAVKEWLNVSAGLRWNALTGLQDGGKAKLVDDVLILPITSFSPGRGKYGNMGSKPITDPTALVHHRGQGSWKKFNPVAEVGKICRTVFGLCEGWSKMQSST